MCTVTIVPKPDAPRAFRMACSRDELHGRASALPPNPALPFVYGDHLVSMPIDPVSGGTWVAANDAGLAITLLNYNPAEPPTDRDLSRGGVIPQLLHASAVDEVFVLAKSIQANRMMPFRLVACDGRSLMLWRSTEPIEEAEVGSWSREPLMWTSSGLGDHVVEGPRRELFEGWFGDEPDAYLDRQDAFHRHRWPDREHLSVSMHRGDARTVSYTRVDVDPDKVTMTYHPDRPDLDAKDSIVTLQRRLIQR
ncbi:MAG: NRDE family protein [Phycisphaeraceae bacterium]|nr:NRDE family protein [Phycisphaeraceae bacterium]